MVKNISKSNLLVLLSIVAILFFVFALWPSVSSKNTTIASPSPITQEVNPDAVIVAIIDFGDGKPVSITLEEEEHTAFSALEEAVKVVNYPLETEQYDFGIFVKSINGFESTAEKSWIYFVNDQPGNLAADQVIISRGDTVSWRYVEPTVE